MDKLLLGILALLVVVVISNPVSNPIANMYGPHFLLFYGFVSAVTLVICRWSAKRDSTANLPLPLVPRNPDPYKIAYLRGGENEITRLVLFNLIQRGYLQITDKTIERSPNYSRLASLFSREQEVFNWFYHPKQASQTFESSLLAKMTQHCKSYEQQLQNEQLLFPETAKVFLKRVGWLGAFIILSLGGYKLMIAVLNGRSNVIFLFLMGVISLIILGSFVQPPRLSQRGQAYLQRLEQTFASLKAQVSTATADTTDFDILLPLALFGVGILAGTPFADFEKMFHLSSASASGGGDGGSCGSGDSGGSGCGGGGCGGGGCGGCGG